MFYQRLRDLREDKDLLQNDIAQIINSSLRQYGLYERGKSEIPLEKALTLAEYYNVSLDYITGRTNDKKGLSRSEMNEQETLLIKNFRSLSESGKGKILERLEMIMETEMESKSKFKDVI